MESALQQLEAAVDAADEAARATIFYRVRELQQKWETPSHVIQRMCGAVNKPQIWTRGDCLMFSLGPPTSNDQVGR